MAARTWRQRRWADPDGGHIRLMPHLPGVRSDARMHPPRRGWQGLALLVPAEEVATWQEEAAEEDRSPGIQFDMALVSGGELSWYLERVAALSGLEGGVFPDPEPWRLWTRQVRAGGPVWCVEPDVSDEQWLEWVEAGITEMTRPLRLLRRIRLRQRLARQLKQALTALEPDDRLDESWHLAAALCSAWWWAAESAIGGALAVQRDVRLAGRLRGALARLRERHGEAAELAVAVPLPRCDLLVEALSGLPEVEGLEPTDPAEVAALVAAAAADEEN